MPRCARTRDQGDGKRVDDFARVKQAVDIVEVIGRHVQLEKRGPRFLGLCPFHNEKTPSFNVHRDDQFFKCFGCGKGGDVFTFVQEIQRIEPREALHQLAEEAGIELTQRGPRGPGRDQRERMRDALAEATRQFRAFAKQRSREFESFLERRRIDRVTADRFAIGLAPAGRSPVADRLRDRGFEFSLLDQVGLGRHTGRGFVDAFRDRIVIPIRDEQGRTVAFGARQLRDGDGPKYLNSREHPLFHKSQVLYGLDLARDAIRESQRVVLVEGYLDVVLAHQADVRSAVAALGTAITEDHAKRIGKLARTAVLFLDGDAAGERAARKATPLLLAAGLEVQVLCLSDGADPGDYFAAGRTRADFEGLLANEARSGLSFLLQVAGAATARSAEERFQVATALVDDLAPIQNPLLRGTLLQEVAAELEIPVGALAEVARPKRAGAKRPARNPKASEPTPTTESREDLLFPPDKHGVAEVHLLQALLGDPSLREIAAEEIPEGTFHHPLRLRLFRALVAERSGELGALVERFPGDAKAQGYLLELAHLSSETHPGTLFDKTVLFFERERKEEQGRRLREQHRLEQRSAALGREQDPASCPQARREEEARRFLARAQAWIDGKRPPQ